MATSITGCSLLDGPPVDTPERTVPAEPDTPAQFFPDGSATDNLPYFTETVREFTRSDSEIEGRPLVDAIVDAGFTREDMQVSFDRSRTGLVADHLYASVRIDSECLLAQVITEDRSFVTRVDAAVGPEKDLCLIGETRVIDW